MSAPSRLATARDGEPACLRTAGLPMYDPPPLHAAHDALWAAIAQRLHTDGVDGAPDRLTRGETPETIWGDPGLLLSQTCGYPLVNELKGRVQLVATPSYQAKGCDGPFHRSAVVVRAGDGASALADLRGRICAINAPTSNTGMNLLRSEIAPIAGGLPFFGSLVITGSHAASARLVAEGGADLAAIDCVTLDQMQRFEPEVTRRLRVLSWSVRSPGLPMITGASTSPATLQALRRALDGVIADPALDAVRADLRLTGFHVLPAHYYRAITYFEQMAIDQGYPDLL
jgi:ABC-type phosphate/phosphonate transport system substrate-binding protein